MRLQQGFPGVRVECDQIYVRDGNPGTPAAQLRESTSRSR